MGLAIVGAVNGLLNGVGGRLQPLEASDTLSRLPFLSGPARRRILKKCTTKIALRLKRTQSYH